MKFTDQSINLLNVDEDNKPLVKQLNYALQFLAKFSNAGVLVSENIKHETKTVTLKDGVVTEINHNGKAPPTSVILLDGRVEWLKVVSKDNNRIGLFAKTLSINIPNTNARQQMIYTSGARYFLAGDTVACGEYRARVSAATTNTLTLERALSLLEPELKLYEEKVTLLLVW